MGNAQILRSAAVLLLTCTLVLPSFCAADPFAGTWKLNVAKSKLQPPAPEADTVHIEIDGENLRSDQEGIDDKGSRSS